jgi:hypothetical protein
MVTRLASHHIVDRTVSAAISDLRRNRAWLGPDPMPPVASTITAIGRQLSRQVLVRMGVSAGLGIPLDAGVQKHARLGAVGPRVVSGVKVHDVAGRYRDLGAVVELDVIARTDRFPCGGSGRSRCRRWALTSLDQRQPGSNTPRPMVKSPRVTTSRWPCAWKGTPLVGGVDALLADMDSSRWCGEVRGLMAERRSS